MRTITEFSKDIYYAMKGIRITDKEALLDNFGEYWRMNKTQHTGYVAACLSTMGFYFSKAKFMVYVKTADKLVKKPDHPFIKLIYNPNDYQVWSELKQFIGIYFGVFGNYYLLKMRGKISEKPKSLIMLDPKRVKPISTKTKFISHYEYNIGTEIISLKKEDIIHLRYPDSSSTIVGTPIIAAIGDVLEVDKFQTELTKKFYKEGGFLGQTFSTNQTMSPASFERAKKELQEKYGGNENSFKVALFEAGTKPIKSAYSMRDMDLTAQRKLTLEEVMTAFRIPQILLGGSSDTYNRATAEAAEFAYASTIIDPLLTYVDEVFTRHVQNDWGKEFVVIHEPVSPKDVKQNLEYYKSMTQIGAMTINESRERERLPALDYPLAKVPILNLGGTAINIATGEIIGPPKVVPPPANKQVKKSDEFNLHWKQFNRRIDNDIKWLERRITEFFDDQKIRILATLSEKNALLVETFYEMEDEMVLLLQMIENGWLRFQDRGSGFSGASGISDYTGRKEQFLNYSRNINDTTKKRIIRRLRKGEDIFRILNDMYDDFKVTRVPGIAETTAVSGFNAGLWLGYRSQGYPYKIWVSQRDDRVRDSHIAVDEQKVKIDELFVVGLDKLMYPGDPIANAEEIINCRCTLIGVKNE